MKLMQLHKIQILNSRARHRVGKYYGVKSLFVKNRAGGELELQTTALGLSIIKSYKLSNLKQMSNRRK